MSNNLVTIGIATMSLNDRFAFPVAAPTIPIIDPIIAKEDAWIAELRHRLSVSMGMANIDWLEFVIGVNMRAATIRAIIEDLNSKGYAARTFSKDIAGHFEPGTDVRTYMEVKQDKSQWVG